MTETLMSPDLIGWVSGGAWHLTRWPRQRTFCGRAIPHGQAELRRSDDRETASMCRTCVGIEASLDAARAKAARR